MQRRQKFLSLMVILGLAPSFARCVGPERSPTHEQDRTAGSESTSSDTTTGAHAPANRKGPDAIESDASQQNGVTTPAPAEKFDGPAYLLKYKFPPDLAQFYVVENQFTDHGGVPPILTFTTHADDKRTFVQTRPPATAGAPAARPADPEFVTLQWECNRYEAREYGMKDEVRFDSLRDSYPRAEIRELGAIPGSTVTFDINPRTGNTRNRRIQPNRSTGPTTRRRLSRTTMRCSLNEENLKRLMDDLGPLFLPTKAVHVGETWTNSRSEEVKSFGRSILNYRFTLTSVTEAEGRTLATISVTGETKLEADPQAASKPATRGRPNGRADKPREFRVDHQACTGTIEFDVGNGELVSLDLLRELDLSASMESEEIQNMRLETGTSHRLRVQVLHDEPRRPLIAGGPKPPANDPPEPAIARQRNAAARPGRTTTSGPAAATTQPNTVRRPPNQRLPRNNGAVSGTGRPTFAPNRNSRTATQPASGGKTAARRVPRAPTGQGPTTRPAGVNQAKPAVVTRPIPSSQPAKPAEE